jgi:hypothetical protein
MICRSLLIVAAAVVLLMLMPEPVFASGSMRCGTHIVTAGQLHGPGKYEVLKKCGEPTQRNGNTWVYDKSGKTQYVIFDASGRLMRIE